MALDATRGSSGSPWYGRLRPKAPASVNASTTAEHDATHKRPYVYEPLQLAYPQQEVFRILILQPGKFGSKISCNVQQASLSSPPKYEALSYTWGDPNGVFYGIATEGDPDQSLPIVLNGHCADIAYNLHTALRHLRHESKSRTLWVDALCIDQTASSERTHQVGVMDKIYRRASSVLAWLGEPDEHVELAFDTLHQIFWAFKVRVWNYYSNELGIEARKLSKATLRGLIRRDVESVPGHARGEGPFHNMVRSPNPRDLIDALLEVNAKFPPGQSLDVAGFVEETWGNGESVAKCLLVDLHELSSLSHYAQRVQAMKKVFFYKNYWNRRWIVQEINNNASVCFVSGYCYLDRGLACIAKYLKDSFTMEETIICPFNNAAFYQLSKIVANMRFVSAGKRGEGMRTLARNLATHGDSLCSEPHDAIYALLSVSAPIDIEIEYDKPVREVYINATRAMIRQGCKLDLIGWKSDDMLSRVFNCQPTVDLPTWVPHFETYLSSGSLQLMASDFDCGGSMIEHQNGALVENSHALPIGGTFYGRITHAYPTKNADWLELDRHECSLLIKPIMDIWNQISEEGGLTGQRFVETDFWSVVFLDEYRGDNLRLARISKSENVRRKFEKDVADALQGVNLPDDFSELFQSLTRNNSTYCISSEGNLGNALGEAEIGDQIFVARGLSYPIIIRPSRQPAVDPKDQSTPTISPQPEERRVYSLVGPAYIHGIMDGEVRAMMDSGELHEETIYLV